VCPAVLRLEPTPGVILLFAELAEPAIKQVDLGLGSALELA
jgi:hypothetical protein